MDMDLTKKPSIPLVIFLICAFMVAFVFFVRRHKVDPSSPTTGNSNNIRKPNLSAIPVPLLTRDIDLSDGIDLEFWHTRAGVTQGLVYQTTIPPWPQPRKNEDELHITIKAFHNSQAIYIYLAWKDVTEDRVTATNTFSDSSAVMFPLAAQPGTFSLLMGMEGAVNIWQWKAEQDARYWLNYKTERPTYFEYYDPFEEEEVFALFKKHENFSAYDFLSSGLGTLTLKTHQTVAARGLFVEGEWNVVFTRPLERKDVQTDANFKQERLYCAFAVWNGFTSDRGGRKLISDWVELTLIDL